MLLWILLSIAFQLCGQCFGMHPQSQQTTDNKFTYPIVNLTLLEKIKFLKVLTQILPNKGDGPSPIELMTQNHQKQQGTPAPVFPLQMAIERRLAQSSPHFANLIAIFQQIILGTDPLLEAAWIVPPPIKIDPLEGVELHQPRPLKAEMHDWVKKWGNFEKYKANLKKQKELNETHQRELRQKGEFQQALNLANLYKLAECLAAKLANIFEKAQLRGEHLKAEYEKKQREFGQWYRQMEKEFLHDARAKNVQNQLICPAESGADRIDGLLVGAIQNNQFGNGLDEGDFVEALAIVLGVEGNGKEVEEDLGTKLAEEVQNGQFGILKELLEAVQRKEQELHQLSKQRQKQQQGSSSELNMQSMILQGQLKKQNLNRVGKMPPQNGQTSMQEAAGDKRYKALQKVLAIEQMEQQQRRLTNLQQLRERNSKSQQQQSKELGHQVKTTKEQILIGGIVPLLIGNVDEGKEGGTSKISEIEEEDDNNENVEIVGGENKNEWMKQMEEKVKLEEGISTIANGIYAKFIGLPALFAFAECTAKAVGARAKNSKKYVEIEKYFGEIGKMIIVNFAKFAKQSKNKFLPKNVDQIGEDVEMIGKLICLPNGQL